MLRLNHHHPVQGLGVSIGFDTDSIVKSIVNAITPAVANAMPTLVNAAWPSVQEKLPGLVAAVVPQALNAAWPAVQAQIPGLVDQAVPLLAAQVPTMVNKGLPILYAKLPEIKKKLAPLVQQEADALVDTYVKKYMGPAYMFKQYAPALTIIGTALTLFASGIIIYRFWADE